MCKERTLSLIFYPLCGTTDIYLKTHKSIFIVFINHVNEIASKISPVNLQYTLDKIANLQLLYLHTFRQFFAYRFPFLQVGIPRSVNKKTIAGKFLI